MRSARFFPAVAVDARHRAGQEELRRARLADWNGRISNASPLAVSRPLTPRLEQVVAAVCWLVAASSIGSRTTPCLGELGEEGRAALRLCRDRIARLGDGLVERQLADAVVGGAAQRRGSAAAAAPTAARVAARATTGETVIGTPS